MPSTVYYADLRASIKRSLMDKLGSLIEEVGLAERVGPRGLSAIKLHFGEAGNTAFIRPVYVRPVVQAIKAAGAKPFITDANTLYVGSRSDAVSHLETAISNGFAYSVVGAPLVIADGLTGSGVTGVEVGLAECETAYIGSEVVEADSLVSMAHFKGHELAGIGGTLKNLGMGCAGRRGKLFQHANVSPLIEPAKCVACGACIERCPVAAIKLVKRTAEQPPPLESDKPKFTAQKDSERCIGCGDCLLACPQHAISIPWDAQVPELHRRMVAYTKGVLAGKAERSVFFNFLTQISPACDCYPFQDAPVVGDLGIVASTDPVAIDQASADLVNAAPGLADSCLKSAHAPGEDKFRDVYPHVDWSIQLDYAQEVGLGSREYELVKV